METNDIWLDETCASTGREEPLINRLIGGNALIWVYGVVLLICAANCTAAIWDGGAQLFLHLHRSEPWVPHTRFYLYPANRLIIALASGSSDTHRLIQMAGVIYALVQWLPTTIACVALSRRPELRLWVVAGVIIAGFPVQLFLGIEISHAMGFVWAGTCLLVSGSQLWRQASAALFLLLAAVAHPATILAFVVLFTALVLRTFSATLRSIIGDEVVISRSQQAIVITALCLRVLLSALFTNPYEAAEYRPSILASQFFHGVLGFPLLAIAGLVLVLVLSFLGARGTGFADRIVTTTLIAGGVWYVAEPGQWSTEAEYRKWLPIFSTMFLAAFLTFAGGRNWPNNSIARKVVGRVALIAMCVVAANSYRWAGMLSRLQLELAATPPGGVVIVAPGTWMYETPLRYWSSTATSLLIQGYKPLRLVATAESDVFTGRGFRVASWLTIPTDGGRFDLLTLETAIERQAADFGDRHRNARSN